MYNNNNTARGTHYIDINANVVTAAVVVVNSYSSTCVIRYRYLSVCLGLENSKKARLDINFVQAYR